MNKYKYIDFLLIAIPSLFLLNLLFQVINSINLFQIIVKLFIALFILGLFFYEKTKSIKAQLFPKFLNIVLKLESFYNPIFKFSNLIIKPIKIGQNIMIDISQILLISVLLIILIIF